MAETAWETASTKAKRTRVAALVRAIKDGRVPAGTEESNDRPR